MYLMVGFLQGSFSYLFDGLIPPGLIVLCI